MNPLLALLLMAAMPAILLTGAIAHVVLPASAYPAPAELRLAHVEDEAVETLDCGAVVRETARRWTLALPDGTLVLSTGDHGRTFELYLPTREILTPAALIARYPKPCDLARAAEAARAAPPTSEPPGAK